MILKATCSSDYTATKNGLDSFHSLLFILTFVFTFLGAGVTRVEGQTWKDWEVCVIQMCDVKLPENQSAVLCRDRILLSREELEAY